jgi:RNA polymerase sigma-70 factor (ECF subfamily)
VPLPEETEGDEMIAVTPDPEHESIRRDEQRLLDRVMATLPQEHREVLVLREVEDLDYREIASVLQIPIGTVMSRLARARAGLRARLPQDTEGEPRAVR